MSDGPSRKLYNYIQYSQSGPRKAPQPEHWEKSELAFKELLQEYLPDYIIVWGVRLYDGLSGWEGEHSLLQMSENDYADVCIYNVNGKRIPANLCTKKNLVRENLDIITIRCICKKTIVEMTVWLSLIPPKS